MRLFCTVLVQSKSFRCNTYGFPRKCCKQKTYGMAKSFRCNTYKNRGWGAFAGMSVGTSKGGAQRVSDLSPFFSHCCALLPTTANQQLLWNQLLLHSFHHDGGCTPLIPYGKFNPYLVTSLLPYLWRRSPRRLLHCCTHGTPTPRPTLPRRSPLARRDCARHSRFRAFHRSASARRPTLLDRNWFRTR